MLSVGSPAAVPANAAIVGPSPSAAPVHVEVVFHPRHPQLLHELTQLVASPSSPWFRHFVSPNVLQSTFGAAPSVLNATRAWLAGQGLRVGATSGNGLMIPATGPVAQVQSAFATPLLQVRLPSGRTAHVNTQAPKVPAALQPSVAAVVGLDSTVQAKPGVTSHASSTTSSTTAPAAPTTTVPQSTTTAPAAPTTTAPAAPTTTVPQSTTTTTAPPTTTVPPAPPSVPDFATGGPMPCTAARRAPQSYTANQLAYAYQFNSLYQRGDLGQGTTVALYEQANYADSDIATYESCYGIHPDIQRVPVNGGTTVAANPSGAVEATADVETLIGMAPKVHLLVYNAPQSYVDSLALWAAIVHQDRAQVISTSWLYCESTLISPGFNGALVEAPLFQEMALQGQSVLAATGDAGSESCTQDTPPTYQLSVADPSSQPDVTAVGGTTITSFGSPPVQAAWNQTGPKGEGTGFPAPFDGQDGRPKGYPGNLAGTGGISINWQMPPWQVGFDTSANSSGAPCGAPAGVDCREVPDVSALASGPSGYAIYGTAGDFGGIGWTPLGGTSLATPLWAALVALADEQTPAHHLGLATPSLYAIARHNPAAFTDVTVGNNNYLAASGNPSNDTCTYGGVGNQPCYRATPGYDMATGLGTPVAGAVVYGLVALQVHITTATLKGATLWHHYWVHLGARGGVQPYTWSVSSGHLPVGLTLNPNTGVLSGRPSKARTYAFSIKVSTPPNVGNPATPATADTVAYHLTVAWPSQLVANQRLEANQRLVAGTYRLVMQGDGNLVVYQGHRPLWSSRTNGHPGAYAIMQGDGNFVVYAPGHRPLWSSRTNGHPGAKVILQSVDGNVVVYAPGHRPLWATGT